MGIAHCQRSCAFNGRWRERRRSNRALSLSSSFSSPLLLHSFSFTFLHFFPRIDSTPPLTPYSKADSLAMEDCEGFNRLSIVVNVPAEKRGHNEKSRKGRVKSLSAVVKDAKKKKRRKRKKVKLPLKLSNNARGDYCATVPRKMRSAMRKRGNEELEMSKEEEEVAETLSSLASMFGKNRNKVTEESASQSSPTLLNREENKSTLPPWLESARRAMNGEKRCVRHFSICRLIQKLAAKNRRDEEKKTYDFMPLNLEPYHTGTSSGTYRLSGTHHLALSFA